MRFYEVRIPRPIQANLILSVEVDELGLSAGLQDRVIQVHEGVIYMDFDRDLMRKQGYGRYEPLNPQSLPPLYVAYREDLAEGSEIVHNDLRERYRRGDADVLAAVKFWAELTDRVRAAMEGGRQEEIGPLLNANFDRRAQVCKISEGNLKMVMAARSVGASAKFTGSGGAIIGTYQDDAMYGRLCEVLEPMRITVFKPILTPSRGEQDV
jgi:glucuronokinase